MNRKLKQKIYEVGLMLVDERDVKIFCNHCNIIEKEKAVNEVMKAKKELFEDGRIDLIENARYS